MGGGCLGAWGMSPHMCTCIHVQKLQMAADMEASMFIMFNMHVCACLCVRVHVCACMHACACVHMCACMGHPPYTHTHAHPHSPTCHPPGGTPGINQNSIELELIR